MATSAISTNLSTMASSAISTNLSTMASSAISSNLSTMATSAICTTNLSIMATSAISSNLSTMASSAISTNFAYLPLPQENLMVSVADGCFPSKITDFSGLYIKDAAKDIVEVVKEHLVVSVADGCFTSKITDFSGLYIKDAAKDIVEVVKGPHLFTPTGSDQEGTIFSGYHSDLNIRTIHGRSIFLVLNLWFTNGQNLEVKIQILCVFFQTMEQNWIYKCQVNVQICFANSNRGATLIPFTQHGYTQNHTEKLFHNWHASDWENNSSRYWGTPSVDEEEKIVVGSVAKLVFGIIATMMIFVVVWIVKSSLPREMNSDVPTSNPLPDPPCVVNHDEESNDEHFGTPLSIFPSLDGGDSLSEPRNVSCCGLVNHRRTSKIRRVFKRVCTKVRRRCRCLAPPSCFRCTH